MPHLLRCSLGHEWAPSSGTASCPQCGQLAETVTPTQRSTAHPGSLDGVLQPQLTAYEILEEIGRGGMGIVYKARHRERDRLVALKIIRQDRIAHPEAVARFRREARAAARLTHPNIVLLFEADQEDDVHYLAMEYVAGVTLHRLVEERGALPADLVCDCLRQTALGLQHAHEQAMIHRDIKPSNLMLQRGGTGQLVKILDMGVARLHQLQHEETLTTLTQHGVVIGTPDYIAPEQVENPHLADIRADLYSLGCTAYFLLSGDVPFRGGSLIQKFDRQRWEVPPSVEQLRPDVPTSVAAVVRRLMEKKPAQRFQSPAELVAALDELARTGGVAALTRRAPLTPLGRLSGHNGPVLGLAFLGDGEHLVSGGRDRTLRTWHVADGRLVGRVEVPREVTALTARGTNVLVGAGVGLRLLDGRSGEERQRFTGHLDAIRAAAFSHDGKLVASAGDDRTVRIWDVETGRARHRLTRHADAVTAVAFSADGRSLLSAGRDQALFLWEVRHGRLTQEFAPPRGAVTGAVFAADGLHVVSAHFDTTLRVWDRETGREMRRLQGHKQMVTTVACSSSGCVASGGNDRVVRLWNLDSGSELAHGEGHTGAVTSIAFSPDGDLLATGGADGIVCLWSVKDYRT